MSNYTRFHEVTTLKIRVVEDTMTVECHEKIFAEENPEGNFPERQVYMRVSSDSSDDDDDGPLVGSERRAARRAKRAREPGPPARMPTGELLSLEEASIRRVLFAKVHKERQRYVNGLIRCYKPREVFVRKYRQSIKVHDGPATTREESSDSLDDLILFDDDHHADDDDAVVEDQVTEDIDNTSSNDSFTEDDDEQNDTTDSDVDNGRWIKRRRMDYPETDDDSTMSSMSSLTSLGSMSSMSSLESCFNF